ncbi:glycoside hydrolase family protein [Pelomyxa schiedti]|nr:glycoside hydrolase family protein [Pelomyxa schiedti]
MARGVVGLLLFVGVVATVSLVRAQDCFVMDLAGTTTTWDHYWERCMGSCHGTTALRQDWRDQLTVTNRELGTQMVRFHGILDDDMSVYMRYPDSGSPNYSFFNIDSIFDFLLSLGMRPLIELSFMPEDLASGTETIFHYKGNITPPKNYTEWDQLIEALASHLIDRYGLTEVSQWYFEVWNEPNCGFWFGTQADYFELYQHTALALKSVNSNLKVGGPATCQSGWITETIEFVEENNVPLDFISTHEYPTDPNANQDREGMYNVIKQTRELAGDYPLLYTEYNDGLFAESLHDNIYAASMAVKTIPEVAGLVDVLSWWTFTDIFEENGLDSVPFHQGFGVQTIYGIPKPAYRAFQLLHATGDSRFDVTYDNVSETVDVLATKNSTHLVILATNFDYATETLGTKSICITIKSYKGTTAPTGILQTIDDNNANPYATWVAMGSPLYPTSAQLQTLMDASQMKTTSITPTLQSSTLSIKLTLTPWAVASITLPLV